jgi:anaerobic selenocysteine-containing dehydrogenase
MDRQLTYCRICAAACGLVVAVDEDRVVEVRGDPDHPISRGYTCAKGRALGEWHHRPDRLDQPRIDGRVATWADTLADLGRRLTATVEARDSGANGAGNDAIAMYLATGFAFDSAGQISAAGFMRAIGSSSFATAATVDNAPVLVVAELVGGQPMLNPVWDPTAAGLLVLIGTNPVVSHGYGTAIPDPVRYLRDHQQRGGKVIVLDPRRTETAALADLHIPAAPGSDVAVLAWLAGEVLKERDHSDRNDLDGPELDTLKAALRPFSLDRAKQAADVDSAMLGELRNSVIDARGQLAMFCGTGVTMARDGVLAEWMRWVLLALTDSLDRPGGMRFHRGVVNRLRRPKQPRPLVAAPRSRPDLPRVAGQLAAVALVDEIEAGNIRALMLAGGNPIASLPQPDRVRRALASLDVLATVDVVESEITRMATHVLPAVGQLERADITLTDGLGLRSGIQATDRVVAPVADRRPVWWIFGQLAAAMGRDLLGGADPDDLDDRTFLSSVLDRSPLDAGSVFAAGPRGLDVPAETGWVLDELVPGSRWQLAPPQLVDRLSVHRTPVAELMLVPYRQAGRSNSVGFREADSAVAETLLHSNEATRLGLVDGDAVVLRSACGEVASAVRVVTTIKPGVVCCSHGRGLAGTGRLIDLDDIDPLTAMPVASGVPVTITRAM